MPSTFHFNVDMDRRPQNEWLFTMNLATGIDADDIGKAVSLDTTKNKVKLAADGDIIFGRLEVVEDNGLGTVSLKFVEELPVKSGETFAVGDTAIGAGAGEVKVRKAGDPLVDTADLNDNVVVEVRTGFVVVYKK